MSCQISILLTLTLHSGTKDLVCSAVGRGDMFKGCATQPWLNLAPHLCHMWPEESSSYFTRTAFGSLDASVFGSAEVGQGNVVSCPLLGTCLNGFLADILDCRAMTVLDASSTIVHGHLP